jgi:16S rRNA pseudouridine516 synthase
MSIIRLDKYLADAGAGTRSQVRNLVKAGRINVNGVQAGDCGMKIDAESAEVLLDGKRINRQGLLYILMNKPAGVVSSTQEKNDRTVVDLLPEELRRGMFPVGRLDRDTEGFLLISNDGKLAHRLLSPKKHVEKKYYAEVDGSLDEAAVEAFASGLDIGDEKPAMPAGLQVLEDGMTRSSAIVTLTEGRYHEVKRLFKAIGLNVTYLKRVSMGALELPDDLEPGQWRELTTQEMVTLNLKDARYIAE